MNFNFGLTDSDIILICTVVLAIHTLSIAVLYSIKKYKDGFDKSLFTNYSVTVIALITAGIYNKELKGLLTNPPPYIFLIPIVWYGFFLLYNITKDKQEVERMLNETQINDLRVEIKDFKIQLKNVQSGLQKTESSLSDTQSSLSETRSETTKIRDTVDRMLQIIDSTESQ